ncbi:MarR family transcriptional regulator [Sedimentibacter sp. zth1]|uniref:MarR family winged helix-turn-helix transcriptional regulator n=1 Tax=Sedimentibacter sp. zth1 TaxID=2816908 RepID=UPI001A91B2E0|nr:MarR family transcriptional regulator [Sedimentibacter sp. zth1]QSX05440.1 MarR family transcriptional regulator [Sedimentibacter sp. zth1]
MNYVSAKQISMLYRKFQKYINNNLKKYDIGSSEYSYLLLLYENNNMLSQDDLHKLSNIDRAAVTRAISSLEKKGYVIKSSSKTNSRHNIIELTDKAISIKTNIFDVINKWNKLIHSDISTEKLNITIDSLNKMLKNTEEN